jgi:hypothetical protein
MDGAPMVGLMEGDKLAAPIVLWIGVVSEDVVESKLVAL